MVLHDNINPGSDVRGENKLLGSRNNIHGSSVYKKTIWSVPTDNINPGGDVHGKLSYLVHVIIYMVVVAYIQNNLDCSN